MLGKTSAPKQSGSGTAVHGVWGSPSLGVSQSDGDVAVRDVGMVGWVGLDLVILEAFSSLNDSMIHKKKRTRNSTPGAQAPSWLVKAGNETTFFSIKHVETVPISAQGTAGARLCC